MSTSTRSLDESGGKVLRGRLRLEVASGAEAGLGVELDVGDVARVGTHPDCRLKVNDDTVSRQHLEVRVHDRGVVLVDLASKNGSFLAGNRFTQLTVHPPLRLRVGQLELRLAAVDRGELARLGDQVAASASMRSVFELVRTAATADAPVLIIGETGTGKEGLARALHDASRRAAGPYAVIDLASVSESLIDSELFGHMRGSFTGAAGDRVGAFEAARGGTVFLDEIGELAPSAQPRLLRVLESRQVKRVGSNAYTPTDVRVVAATNRQLASEVEAGRFRADLYHRLAVLTIEIPPLRDRPEDLPALVEAMAAARPADLPIHIPPETIAAMAAYDWPGNVRQLRNVLERAAIVAGGGHITPELLGLDRANAAPGRDLEQAATDLPFKEAKQRLVDAWEREYVERLLRQADGNVTVAARVAGLARVHLHRLLKKHGHQHQ
ncbi:MAG TPA: sigma 54-interacting transcriptional regulator [Kofleriaceae bacterium]|nr:sigma 54-interacting transcriptional regulator [Kofleriaceae bacterium]